MPHQDIKELNLLELKDILKYWGCLEFHAGQIFTWIYQKGIMDFDKMSDLPVQLRSRLQENFYTSSLKLQEEFLSRDKTKKFLFELEDGNLVESVLIPTESRATGCISTQVGCKFACKFCASGLSGFKRNLTQAEILDQVLYLKNHIADNRLTHIVFMGIGEPLDNYNNVLKAIRIINADYAFNIAARRITISTCGIAPAINRLAEEGLQVELSISLHASDDQTRTMLMPVNKKYPLRYLIEACQEYIIKTKRQITFEYVMMQGINSDLTSARNLVKIVRILGLCKINLIPANTIKEINIAPPKKLEILLFRDVLIKSGVNVTLRRARGEDIEAACGQLKLRYSKNK